MELVNSIQHIVLEIHPCCPPWKHLLPVWIGLPLCVQITLSFSVYLWIDFENVSTPGFVWITLWECHCLFESPISVLLDEYPDIDCGSYGSSVFSFVKDLVLFSTVAAPICIPTHGHKGSASGTMPRCQELVMIAEQSWSLWPESRLFLKVTFQVGDQGWRHVTCTDTLYIQPGSVSPCKRWQCQKVSPPGRVGSSPPPTAGRTSPPTGNLCQATCSHF